VVIRPLGDTIVLMPALVMAPDEVAFCVDVLTRAITEVTG